MSDNVDQLDVNFTALKTVVFRTLTPSMADNYLRMMNSLRDDELVAEDGRTYLGLLRAPAAKRNHHATEGGLVRHLLEMWDIYKAWCTHWPLAEQSPHINDERVLCAILNHDIHKAYRTFYQLDSPEWAVEYGYRNKEKPELTDGLMTESVKSMWILSQYGITPDAEQMNALCLSHGGFSEIVPKRCTPLAKLMYLIDEFSGNVLEPIRQKDFLDDHRATRYLK